MLTKSVSRILCRCACHESPTAYYMGFRRHTKMAAISSNTQDSFVSLSGYIEDKNNTIKKCLQSQNLINKNNTQDELATKCPFRHEQTDNAPFQSPLELTTAKPFTEIPGPQGLPAIGNAIKYSKFGPYKFEKILDNRLAYAKKYGHIYREKLGQMDMVHIFDPSDLATMFRLEGQYPSRGAISNLELTYLKRNKKLVGFAFLDGPEWARQRQIIQKVMMHPKAATRYLHMQLPVVKDFVQYLNVKKDCDGLVPNLYEDIFKYTMEAIGVVCFDERLGTFSLDNEKPSQMAQDLTFAISETFYCFRQCMFSIPFYQYLRTPMYRRFEKASNKMREIMGEHVQSVADKVAKGNTESGALCPFAVELLQEDRSMFEVLLRDDRVTKELAVNLIMALFRTGIDSTGNALAFLLYNLARNPDKQEVLYKEIKENLSTESLSPEALSRMSYLKAALKESFRLNFPVFGGSGRVLPTDVVLSGYKVPKGKFLFANMAAMGVMEEFFPKPKEFHPERWLRDDRAMLQTKWQKDSAFISLPFSAGMRACPGKRFAEQALCIAVVNILQEFRLEHDGPELGMIHMPFTTPDGPLNIKFISRNNQLAIDNVKQCLS